MTEVRTLPAQEPRVETGVVQFGDDWPGVFIRGDSAFAYAMYLEHLIKAPATNVIVEASVRGLLGLLRSCDARTLPTKVSQSDEERYRQLCELEAEAHADDT